MAGQSAVKVYLSIGRQKQAELMSEMVERILEAAERRVRLGGYHGFSFRDLAGDVGIKSASVHHHFPTKEALVARLIAHYREKIEKSLGNMPAGQARIAAYRSLFRGQLTGGFGMCLGGMLGVESEDLPCTVGQETRRFFEMLVTDLAKALAEVSDDPASAAFAIVAQLEGAMLLARSSGDVGQFDRATTKLEALL
jgi:TetR/AcrR family transcriptional regulator, transcriptional repressor for nem operon